MLSPFQLGQTRGPLPPEDFIVMSRVVDFFEEIGNPSISLKDPLSKELREIFLEAAEFSMNLPCIFVAIATNEEANRLGHSRKKLLPEGSAAVRGFKRLFSEIPLTSDELALLEEKVGRGLYTSGMHRGSDCGSTRRDKIYNLSVLQLFDCAETAFKHSLELKDFQNENVA